MFDHLHGICEFSKEQIFNLLKYFQSWHHIYQQTLSLESRYEDARLKHDYYA